MANNFVAGYKGTVTIGGTQFAALQFDLTITTPLDDITYTQAGGATWAVKIPGYSSAKGTISFVYDTLNQPVLSPQNMTPGTLMTLVLTPEGSKSYSFSAYSGEFSFSSGPQSGIGVKCTTSFESTGTVTLPSS